MVQRPSTQYNTNLRGLSPFDMPKPLMLNVIDLPPVALPAPPRKFAIVKQKIARDSANKYDTTLVKKISPNEVSNLESNCPLCQIN